MKTDNEIIQLEVTFNRETRLMDFWLGEKSAMSCSDVAFQIGHGEKRHADRLHAYKIDGVWKVSTWGCIRNKQARACGFIDLVNDSMKTKQNYYGSFKK
jgi:hypothetical protein